MWSFLDQSSHLRAEKPTVLATCFLFEIVSSHLIPWKDSVFDCGPIWRHVKVRHRSMYELNGIISHKIA